MEMWFSLPSCSNPKERLAVVHLAKLHLQSVVVIIVAFQSAQPNDIRYLPPEYDCTPTKRVKTEASASPNASIVETPKKYNNV